MKLVENGRLQLDAPTSKYLPAFAAGQTAVPTIRNLLQQNSGLPEWDVLPALEDPDAGDPGRFHLAKLVEIIARRPLLYRPGEWWSYSNSNYTVLAAVIEQATVAGYNEYLASTFFVRLGLRSTDVCGSVRLASRDRAIGYRDTQAYAPRPVTTTKANAYIGAASLCSNVVDLANWMRALVDGKAISAASFRQMTTATPVRAGFTPPYGFGVSLLPLVGQRAIWHGGALSGYMADLAYFPDHDLIISILGNARRVRLEQIVKDVARELLWVPTPQLLDLAIDSTLAKRVAGNYDDGMFTFRIFMAGPELFLDVPPAVNPTRLRYQGGREFVTARPTDFRLRFEPEAGQTQRVVWEWGELRAYGRRTR
jgi:CubicO group peptidase (beta-lactamase class C family)